MVSENFPVPYENNKIPNVAILELHVVYDNYKVKKLIYFTLCVSNIDLNNFFSCYIIRKNVNQPCV